MRVVDPLLPLIATELGISLGRAGLIITAYSLPYGLCVLGYGPLGDRFGKLRIIIGATALSALCISMCGFASDLPSLMFWRFMSGATCSATVPLSLAFIADNFPLPERQKALARYTGGVILGQICGAGLGGVFADLIGWRHIFHVYGFLTAGATFLVWWGARHLTLPPPKIAAGGSTWQRYRAVFRLAEAREVMLAVFLEGLLLFGSSAFIGSMLHYQYHLSLTWVGLMLMFVGGGSLVYTALVGWLMKHLGQRGMIMLGGILMLLCYTTLAHSSDRLFAAPALLLFGLSIYLMHNNLQTLGTELSPMARGTSVSLMAFMLFSGQALGAFCLGMVIDRVGYRVSYSVIAAALCGLAGWLQGTRAVTRGLHQVTDLRA